MDKKEKSFHYTPVELAKNLISLVKIKEGDTLLEPFKGGGAFYDNFPSENKKYYYEIDEDKDFFEAPEEDKYDVIITNPPYRVDGKNAAVKCLDKCFEVCNKKVCVLINNQMFNSMTPNRLNKWEKLGWSISKIHICNVKKWFGRYYFIQFTKRKKIVSFDTKSYYFFFFSYINGISSSNTYRVGSYRWNHNFSRNL